MKPIRVFNHTFHKEMWYWLANHPDRHKHEWPGWRKLSGADRVMMGNEYSLCFACYAAGHSDNMNADSCTACPLDWASCCGKNSMYAKWSIARWQGKRYLATGYARRIAELPLRKNLDGGRFAIVVI